MAKLFNIPSLKTTTSVEEVKLVQVEEPITLETITNDVETNEEIHEANEELREQCTSIEEHIEAVGLLTDQVVVNEQVIDCNPYEVTDATVELSQEHLSIVLGRLGVDIDQYETMYKKNYRIRVASENRPNPIKKLQISTEGIKEVIQSLIEKIRRALKALVHMFKKLITKLTANLEAAGKKAESLKGKLEGATLAELDDELKTKISDKWKYIQILENVANVYDFVRIEQTITASINNFDQMAKKLDEPNFNLADFLSKRELAVKKEYLPEKVTKGIAIKFCGGKCKVLGSEDGIKFDTITLKPDSVQALTNFTFDKAMLGHGLDMVIKNAKEVDNYMKKTEGIRRECEKVLDTISKKPSGELTDNHKTLLSLAGKLGSVISLDIINNFADFNKAIVATANILINKKQDDDDKKDEQEKKEEEKKEDKEES